MATFNVILITEKENLNSGNCMFKAKYLLLFLIWWT